MEPPPPPRRPKIESTPVEPKRKWPLDVVSLTLGAVVLYLVVSQLRLDDPRWWLNPKTYFVAVPLFSVSLAVILRFVFSRFFRQSIQLGFLISLIVHLILLIAALQYVVFSRYEPMASNGDSKQKPIRKTISEHLFRPKENNEKRPDWSKPIDSETSDRVVPQELPKMPPLQQNDVELQMPNPKPFRQERTEKQLIKRQQPTSSQPTPANAAGKLARREIERQQQANPSEQIAIPKNQPSPAQPQSESLPDRSAATANLPRRSTNQSTVRAAAQRLPTMRDMSQLPKQTLQRSAIAPAASPSTNALPTVGNAGQTRQRRATEIGTAAPALGAAPTPIEVAVAQELPSASMALRAVPNNMQRMTQQAGSRFAPQNQPSFSNQPTTSSQTTGTQIARNQASTLSGGPQINAGSALRATGRSRRPSAVSGAASTAPIELPGGSGDQAFAQANTGQAMDSDPFGAIAPASSGGNSGNGSTNGSTGSGQTDSPAGSALNDSGLSGSAMGRQPSSLAGGSPLLVDAATGPAGLGRIPSRKVGLPTADAGPQIASIDLPRRSRRRPRSGSPVEPAGAKVAAVQSFAQRMQRTNGGSVPQAGMGGPETEAAIERGLAYLARIQNDDGSWSLQGHGEPVQITSNTAATGLALLAFQGAGYTHKQHQYAPQVAKGIDYLRSVQRPSGNLYRAENPATDPNAMFYSHGIAALALCEAYGMTQDPELRPAAQRALDFIMQSQHQTLGGWRYQSQIGSDTSVSGWMMMALKSGELSGLTVRQRTYEKINDWLTLASGENNRRDRYRYNPLAADTLEKRHGRRPTPTMTSVGMLMRMYSGWRRDRTEMRSAADYLIGNRPALGTTAQPQRDCYYWYYATQFMFHMGDKHWEQWNQSLNPLLIETQETQGDNAGSWSPLKPVPDKWGGYAGRVYVTTLNLMNLEIYYRHLPIYDDTAK